MNPETRQAEQAALEERILDADARGDSRELTRLQARFRTGGYAVSRVYPGSRVTLATAPSRPARVASRAILDEPIVPTVASTSSTTPIVFGAGAREEIIEAPIDTGLERGGWLVGRFADGAVVVETATLVRLPFNPYLTTSCRLPSEDRALWDQHFSAAGWKVLGDWHVHPKFRGDGQRASEGDRRGWQSLADRRGHPWLGLIVSASSGSEHNGADWRWPRFHGWLAQPNRTIIHPVHLTLSED